MMPTPENEEINAVPETEASVRGNEKLEKSPYEELARDMGWRPEPGEAHDPRKPWLDPEQFVRREMENLRKQSRSNKAARNELKELRQVVQELREEMENILAQKPQESLEALERQFEAAVSEGELERAKEIKAQIIELEIKKRNSGGQRRLTAAEREQARTERIIQEWKEENPWYDENEEMGHYADKLFDGQKNRDGSLKKPLEEVLEYVEEQVKKKFSKYGENTRSQSVSDVINPAPAGGGQPARKHKFTYNDLSESRKKICDTLLQNKTIKSRQEYVDILYEDYPESLVKR